MLRKINAQIRPDEATGLFDVKRLAALLDVRPSSIRTLRQRNQLPEPTSSDINGGAVWAHEIINDFFSKQDRQLHPTDINPELPSIIDLFSGCGGMSLGFQLAGFEILAGYDNWPEAVDTYSNNLGHEAAILDLSDVPETIATLQKFGTPGNFPAIIGGPPCQDFSSAGLRIEGDRADLTEKFADVVSHFLPPFFVMENVERAKNAAALSRAIDIFENAGYSVDKIVLDASLCGVPQKRKRLFTIGTMQPEKTQHIIKYLRANLRDKPMTVREWFGDRIDIDAYYRHPRSYARRGVFSVDEPSPTIRGVNRPIPKGYPGHPGDVMPAHKVRPLTTAERAEVQTFPPGFKFSGSRTNTEQMIGNAVPVRLAKYVASAIAEGLI